MHSLVVAGLTGGRLRVLFDAADHEQDLCFQFLSLLLQERPRLLLAEISCLIEILSAGNFTRDVCALALALSLFEANGWDERLFRFALIKCFNGAHVRDMFADARKPNPGLLAFFLDWLDCGSRFLYEFVLNFLDRTESCMDFRAGPRHYRHCRKTRQVALLGADGEWLEVYVRETAATTAVRNFLFAHFHVALTDVHVDVEALDCIRIHIRIHIGFRVALCASRPGTHLCQSQARSTRSISTTGSRVPRWYPSAIRC
jgi:hypothetical protein